MRPEALTDALLREGSLNEEQMREQVQAPGHRPRCDQHPARRAAASMLGYGAVLSARRDAQASEDRQMTGASVRPDPGSQRRYGGAMPDIIDTHDGREWHPVKPVVDPRRRPDADRQRPAAPPPGDSEGIMQAQPRQTAIHRMARREIKVAHEQRGRAAGFMSRTISFATTPSARALPTPSPNARPPAWPCEFWSTGMARWTCRPRFGAACDARVCTFAISAVVSAFRAYHAHNTAGLGIRICYSFVVQCEQYTEEQGHEASGLVCRGCARSGGAERLRPAARGVGERCDRQRTGCLERGRDGPWRHGLSGR